jgi:hypothetical protein
MCKFAKKESLKMKNMQRTPMNQAQMMVLNIVQEQYSEQDLAELRQLLIDFNHRKMQNHLEKTVTDKKYTAKDFEKMLKGHARKTH